jgi:hypothetical protein
LLPNVDEAYDLGSFTNKVKDLYLSGESLWLGDTKKIAVHDEMIRFRKRNATEPYTLGGIDASGIEVIIESAGLSNAGDPTIALAARNFIGEFADPSGNPLIGLTPGKLNMLYVENIVSKEHASYVINDYTHEDIGTATPAFLTLNSFDPSGNNFDPFNASDDYILMIEEQPVLNASGLLEVLQAPDDLITNSGGGSATGPNYPGNAGEIRRGKEGGSTEYLYICVAMDTWTRVELEGSW